MRSRLRRRWPAAVGIAVLLGLTVGIAMFTIAGARRTQSAYPRMLRDIEASTMVVLTFFDAAADDVVAALPEVVSSRTTLGLNAAALDAEGRPDPSVRWEAAGSLDGRFFDQDRFTPTAGRAADPDAIGEVVVNEHAADELGLQIGQQFDIGTYRTEDAFEPTFVTDPPPPESVVPVTIVGIGLFAEEVLQDDADRDARLLLTPAFTQAHRQLATYSLQGLVLEGGDADVPAVRQQVTEIFPTGNVKFRVTSVDTFHAQQAIRPISLTLALFGVVIGVAGLVLVGLACGRLVRAERGEHAALRSFGIGRGSLAVADAVIPLTAVVAGSLLAVLVAAAASPLAPFGPVRRIEVSSGIDVDLPVLGGVLLAALVALGAIVVAGAWRGARSEADPVGVTAHLARWRTAGTSVLPTTGAVGLNLTFGTDQRERAPSRSVVAGAIIGVAAVILALTFGASLDRLVERPELYGWDWDAVLLAGTGYGNIDPAAADPALSALPDVDEWSGVWFGSDLIDGREVSLLGVDPGADVTPPIIEGRPIAADDEIVLGAATAQQLGVGIGDDVRIGEGDRTVSLEVVGLATFPAVGPIHAARTSLGTGAMLERSLVPGSDLDITGTQRGDFGPNAMLVRLADGVDRTQAFDRLEAAIAPVLDNFAGLDVLDVQRPAEIVNSGSIGGAPLLLAGVLLIGALLSLALSIGTFVRRRRHDLAVCRTLGFTSRQLSATVAWQAVLLVTPGVVLGVPLGLLLGKLVWDDFASRMNAIASVGVPALGIAVAVSYLVALLAAALRARQARTIEPATLLRAE